MTVLEAMLECIDEALGTTKPESAMAELSLAEIFVLSACGKLPAQHAPDDTPSASFTAEEISHIEREMFRPDGYIEIVPHSGESSHQAWCRYNEILTKLHAKRALELAKRHLD